MIGFFSRFTNSLAFGRAIFFASNFLVRFGFIVSMLGNRVATFDFLSGETLPLSESSS